MPGESIIYKFSKANPTLPKPVLRYGYHAIPSMKPLHLHIVSQDFISQALKKKKHYLSFTSPFFMDAESVESKLEWSGSLDLSPAVYETMLKGPLSCHVCGKSQPNMPKLKAHLVAHDES